MRRIKAKPVNGFKSKLEQQVAAQLEANRLLWKYEPITINHWGRKYTPDFLAFSYYTPRMLIEVKPSACIDEIRIDMIETISPLWMVADVFIVATEDGWRAMGDGGDWVDCVLGPYPDGLTYPPMAA